MEREEHNRDAGSADITCNNVAGSEDRSAEGDDCSAYFCFASTDKQPFDERSADEQDPCDHPPADNNKRKNDRADNIDCPDIRYDRRRDKGKYRSGFSFAGNDRRGSRKHFR